MQDGGGGLVRWLAGAALASAGAVSAQPVGLRFATEPFPPYTYEAQGHAAGPMVDVLQAACARLGWRCSVEVVPWRRALNMARSGEVHGLFTVLDSPERRQFFHVSQPVIDARYTLFTRSAGFQYAGDPQVLAGRSIGAYGPSGTSLALQELIAGVAGAQAAIEPDNRTVLRKLAAGRYGDGGLALVNEAVAQVLMQEDGLTGVRAAGAVKRFGYSFGLNRERLDAAQAQAFSKALDELCRSGRTAELLKPYGLPASACVRP